ncbi:MAG: hypothetical protein ACREDR_45515 [Blastocatellia bacterium]
MRDMDEELRLSLRRTDPSPDFTARVLMKIEISQSPRQVLSFKRRLLPESGVRAIWLAAASILLAALIAGVWLYARRQRSEIDPRQARLPVLSHEMLPDTSTKKEPGREDGKPQVVTDQHVALVSTKEVRRRHKSKAQLAARAEGMQAKRELMAALYVTSEKLNFAESRVRHVMIVGQRQHEAPTQSEPER